MTRTVQHLRVLVTTTEPWRFAGYMVASQWYTSPMLLATSLERVKFTDELPDDIHERLLNTDGVLAAEVSPVGAPRRRASDAD